MVAKTGVIHDLNIETLSHMFSSRQSQIEEELQQIEVAENPMDWELPSRQSQIEEELQHTDGDEVTPLRRVYGHNNPKESSDMTKYTTK